MNNWLFNESSRPFIFKCKSKTIICNDSIIVWILKSELYRIKKEPNTALKADEWKMTV